MRRPVIAGNWKMYKTQAEARAYFAAFQPLVAAATHCEIVIAPAFTALAASVDAVAGSNISIAAQDVYWEREGAFTGEVSTPMLVEV
ncbi:MAG TPA: triose-phosphate isomerase, partial [Candidatus Acidoferrales bacterium]